MPKPKMRLSWPPPRGATAIQPRLARIAVHPRASASHRQTARLYRLYTEAFADRDYARTVLARLLRPKVVAQLRAWRAGEESPIERNPE